MATPLPQSAPAHVSDAFRIQAAALAAQQAETLEQEIALQARQVALDQHENQLGELLDEKRRRLFRKIRRLRKAESSFEKQQATATSDIESMRQALADELKSAQATRGRSVALFRRLRSRGKKERQSISEKEAVLANKQAAVNRDFERLQLATAEVDAARQRSRAERDELAITSRNQHQRATDLADAEQRLRTEQQSWAQTLTRLRQESAGLENRIVNERRRLLAVDSSAPISVDNPPVPLESPSQKTHSSLPDLRRLLETLADERLQVQEVAARCIQVGFTRQEEVWCVLAELEAAAVRLHEAEQELERGGARQNAERRALALQRQRLDVQQARLAAQERVRDSRMDDAVADARAEAESAAAERAALAELRQGWLAERDQELAILERCRTDCLELRHDLAAQGRDWLRQNEALFHQQRTWGEKALALAQFRQELLGRAPHAAAANKRLHRLRRRWAKLHKVAIEEIDNKRQALGGGLAKIESRLAELNQCLVQLPKSFSQTIADVAQEPTALAVLTAEKTALVSDRERQNQLIASLQEDIERLAKLFLDDAVETPTLRIAA